MSNVDRTTTAALFLRKHMIYIRGRRANPKDAEPRLSAISHARDYIDMLRKQNAMMQGGLVVALQGARQELEVVGEAAQPLATTTPTTTTTLKMPPAAPRPRRSTLPMRWSRTSTLSSTTPTPWCRSRSPTSPS